MFFNNIEENTEREGSASLTLERHQFILDCLKKQGVVKLQDLVQLMNVSESTIRRDLIELENQHLLKRIHGGATLPQKKSVELSIAEKSSKNLQTKKKIGAFAASLVNDGDCLFLDAGSTTLEMIPHLAEKPITVVTNGLPQLKRLVEFGIKAYVLGGMMKPSTQAMIGSLAQEGLRQFRFDQCFLGINGIHPELGYTTPDPEEALIKKTALRLSSQTYILADQSKFAEVAFAKVADIGEISLITDQIPEDSRQKVQSKTFVYEVGT